MLDSDYRRHVPPHLRAAMDRLRDPQAVWDIFRNRQTVAEMERLTALKRPALGAASAKLLALGEWVRGNDARKTFGKIARCIMAQSGYIIDSDGVETPEDPLFTKGTRYRPPAPAANATVETTIIIRDLDPDLIGHLQRRAARNGRSVGAEAAHILVEVLGAERCEPGPNLAEAIHRRFAALGGVDDLPPHPPVLADAPPTFEP